MKTALLLAALVFAGCSKKSEAPAPAPAPAAQSTGHIETPGVQKDPAKAQQMIAGGALVFDVRTPDEFKDGHLPQATNIPIEDFSTRIAEVDKATGGDKSKPIVVYCAKGGRAAKAKAQLDKAGYTNVVNGGGYDDLH